MKCKPECRCQCNNSACGCLSPGRQPKPRPKTTAQKTDTYRSEKSE